MAVWVIDASVVLKWLLADPENEPDTERATMLVASLAAGEHELVQPVHWLVEVAAVLARLSPDTAADDVMKLRAMDWPVADDAEVWARACHLAIETRQHLFDTLYHAVALWHRDATLVTADERYRVEGERFGRIVALRNWTPGITDQRGSQKS